MAHKTTIHDLDPAHIIQLIPLTNRVFAVYSDDNGKETKSQIHFAGLQADGEIVFLDSDSSGVFDIPNDAGNFIRYEFLRG